MTISGTPVSTNLYATVATLKTRLGISDTDDDTTLGLVLSGVCRAIDGHCGQRFYMDASASVRYYTAHDKSCVYAQTWAATDYDLMPSNASGRDRPYTWIETAPDGDYNFPTRSLGVKLTAVYGWPSVPSAVSEAALLWAERIFKRKDAPFGIASFIEAGEMRLIKEIDPDVQRYSVRHRGSARHHARPGPALCAGQPGGSNRAGRGKRRLHGWYWHGGLRGRADH